MRLDSRILVQYAIVVAGIIEWTIASRPLGHESDEGILETAEAQVSHLRDFRYRFDKPDSEYEMSASEFLKTPEICCGSVMPINPEKAEATGVFSRGASAGSVKDTDPHPPIAIRDLEIKVPQPRTVELSWTTPGDDFDTGSVSRYIVRLSDRPRDLREDKFDQAVSFGEVNFNDLFSASQVFSEAGSKVKVNFTVDDMIPVSLRPERRYYLAMRAYDDQNNSSPVSNVATFSLPSMGHKFVATSTTTKRPTTTTNETTTTVTTEPRTKKATSVKEEQCSKCVCECHCTKKGREKNKDKKKCKGEWRRKIKRGRKKNRLQQDPQDTPNLVELWKRYGPGECQEESLVQNGTGSIMCNAISGLRMAIDYFVSSRDFCYSNYISDVVKRLEKRARKHARRGWI